MIYLQVVRCEEFKVTHVECRQSSANLQDRPYTNEQGAEQTMCPPQ